jgi:cytochrome c-type biogenesis protein CcmE
MAYSTFMAQEGLSQGPHGAKGIRWGWIVAGLISIALMAFFSMKSMEGNIQYYMTVSEYFESQAKYEHKKIKLAGKVKAQSLLHSGSRYEFVVEDAGKELHVIYDGFAPDTFKEGSDVVVEGSGRLDENFTAVGLMAKCASKYNTGGLPPLEQMRTKSRR